MIEVYVYCHTPEQAHELAASCRADGFVFGVPAPVHRAYLGRAVCIAIRVSPDHVDLVRAAAHRVDGVAVTAEEGPVPRPRVSARPGGPPFIDRLPRSVIERYEAERRREQGNPPGGGRDEQEGPR